ncbi:MAG TPA: hypothetical protein VEC37_20000 [Bacillota bacterium]|nr:hypothetical protein [Bacillota bacterium]
MDELPFALGRLGLTTEEFAAMTPREYQAKCKGYFDALKFQNQLMLQQVWLTGLMVGRAMAVSEENPYPSFEEFAQEPAEEEPEEDLFRLAQAKGIAIPKGALGNG